MVGAHSSESDPEKKSGRGVNLPALDIRCHMNKGMRGRKSSAHLTESQTSLVRWIRLSPEENLSENAIDRLYSCTLDPAIFDQIGTTQDELSIGYE